MKKCGWSRCYDYASRVYTNHIRGVESYSCSRHIESYCSLCDEFIGRHLVKYHDDYYINRHFIMMHTLKESTGNYIHYPFGVINVVNKIYHNFGIINGYRVCDISNIAKNNPHFIYLVPEFSISYLLDMFDEVKVDEWSLLAAVRCKQFSCLICGGLFESFPSNEVFAAHPCKS